MDEDESTAQLKRLVTSGFVGAPIPDEHDDGYIALVYMRWWSSGSLDVVTVYDEGDAAAYRAQGLDPRHPESVDKAIVGWRTAGTVLGVTSEILELPAPAIGGVPVSVRPADQRAVTHGLGELWTA